MNEQLTLDDWKQVLASLQQQKKSAQLTQEMNEIMEDTIQKKIDKLKKEKKS